MGDSKHVHMSSLMPKSWLSVHQDQTEIWKELQGGEGKKWLHYFARQKGNAGWHFKNCAPLPGQQGEAIQSGKECDRDQQ